MTFKITDHPKIRAFVTHGGLFSIIEATYYRVPIVGMPVFMDQIGNTAQAVFEGWALKIDWINLEENQLRRALEDIVANKTYGANFFFSNYNDISFYISIINLNTLI